MLPLEQGRKKRKGREEGSSGVSGVNGRIIRARWLEERKEEEEESSFVIFLRIYFSLSLFCRNEIRAFLLLPSCLRTADNYGLLFIVNYHQKAAALLGKKASS